MRKIQRIFWHEVVRHLQQRSFIIATLSIPLLSLIIAVVVAFLNSNENLPRSDELLADVGLIPDVAGLDDGSITIGYVDHANVIDEVPEFIPPDLFQPFPNEAAARAAIKANEIEAYYVIAADYMETGEITRFAPEVQGFEVDSSRFASLLRANLLHDYDPAFTLRLGSLLNLETVRLDQHGNPVAERDEDTRSGSTTGKDRDATDADDAEESASNIWETSEVDSDNPIRFIASFIVAMLLYVTIFSASSLLLNSVIEEKENCTLEILLTSLRPSELLAGKVLGLGTLGLGQSLIWFGTGRLMLDLGTYEDNMGLLEGLYLPTFVWGLLIVYFLFGYLIYASLMAGIGAIVPSTREASSLTLLLAAPFMVPFILLGPISERPDSLLSTILSVFPLTAPVTMMMRVVITDVTWWQIGLSILLMAVSVVVCIWLAARMFRVSTLLTGKKFTPAELWRILKT